MEVTGSTEIVGREEELATIERTLDAPPPRALVLDGEPGIGKTTLWREGVAAAERRGFAVALCRPGPAEVQLSFAAVGDLVGALDPGVVERLPDPQRHALEAALLLRDAPRGGIDARAVGSAALACIGATASSRPVLLAIDDLQWLDDASAVALQFALRRLTSERVVVLAAARTGATVPLGLDRSDVAVERVEVGPLAVGALQRLLRVRGGYRFPRPVLIRLHELAGGNPFIALELAAAVARRDLQPGEPLPIPASVAEAIEERLAQVDATAAELLLELAAGGRVRAVAELDPAFAAGLVEPRGAHVEFAHPLFAGAVYARAAPGARLRVHARLAESATSAEERARHLALAFAEPDEHAAATVEAAGREALRRGAVRAAVELLERAVDLTPASERAAYVDRSVGRAEAVRRLGDEEGARDVARAALASVGDDRVAAPLLVWLADADKSVESAERALAASAADPSLAAAAFAARAEAHYVHDDLAAAVASAREALAAARAAGDDVLLVRALGHVGHFELLTGNPDGIRLLEDACALQDVGEAATLLHGPRTALAIAHLWHDRLDEAIGLLREQRHIAATLGDESARASISLRLARASLWRGALAEALRLTDELVELGEASGWRDPFDALWIRSLVHAHSGRVDDARADARRAAELAAANGDPDHFHVVYALGVAELAAGEAGAAAAALSRLPGLVAATGIREPGVCPFHADELEALVRSGRTADAVARVAEVEEEGLRLGRARLLVAAWRARALLDDAAGDRDAARAGLERALVETDRLPVPVERGRTLLELGRVLRRLNRRGDAREALGAARETFEAIGAHGLAARAADELARVSGRARSNGGLTPAEERVVELAVRGLTTKEIAAKLVVSPKTIEKHLSRVYEKLGVRSRAELAHRVASAKEGGNAP